MNYGPLEFAAYLARRTDRRDDSAAVAAWTSIGIDEEQVRKMLGAAAT